MFTGSDAQLVPGFQGERPAVFEWASADLRTAQILQNCDVTVRPCGSLPDVAKRARVGLVSTVRKVEAEDVHTGRDERVECGRRTAGGSERGDDLRVSHDQGSTSALGMR